MKKETDRMFYPFCGVYKIESKIKPNRVYIGSSTIMNHRFWAHKNDLIKNKHNNPKLQRHYNKYGADDFIFSIVEQFDFISKGHLISREQYYIDLLKPYFNVLKLAGTPLGFKLSKESIEKIRQSRIGVPLSDEHRAALVRGWKKRRLKPLSEETRRKKSEAKKGNIPWSKGLTKETDERLAEMAAKAKGKIIKQETRDKIRRRLKGIPKSPEHIKKAAEARRGIKEPPEVTIAKSIRAKEWWRKKREQDALLMSKSESQ